MLVEKAAACMLRLNLLIIIITIEAASGLSVPRLRPQHPTGQHRELVHARSHLQPTLELSSEVRAATQLRNHNQEGSIDCLCYP